MRPAPFLLAAMACALPEVSAQIAVDTAPPRVDTFIPTVYGDASIGDRKVAGPVWIPAETRSLEGIAMIPAHVSGQPVDGALQLTAPLALVAPETDPSRAPATPRFAVTRVMVAKFEILGRVFETGILEAQLQIDRRGRLRAVEASDRRVIELVEGFFKDLPDKTPFEPAAQNGKAVASTLRFRWDLRLERPPEGSPPRPALVEGTACPLPAVAPEGPTDVVFYVWGGPVTEVTGIAIADGAALPPAAREALLQHAFALSWGTENAAGVEAWRWAIDRTARLARRTTRRALRQVDPVMRHAPRPEYPAKLWRKGPEGFAYVQFTIDTEGRTRDLKVLEATEKAFGTAALEAVVQWEFEPMQFDGTPIASEVIMTLPFRLPPRR